MYDICMIYVCYDATQTHPDTSIRLETWIRNSKMLAPERSQVAFRRSKSATELNGLVQDKIVRDEAMQGPEATLIPPSRGTVFRV